MLCAVGALCFAVSLRRAARVVERVLPRLARVVVMMCACHSSVFYDQSCQCDAVRGKRTTLATIHKLYAENQGCKSAECLWLVLSAQRVSGCTCSSRSFAKKMANCSRSTLRHTFKANVVPIVSLGIQVRIGGLQSCEEIIPVWSVLDF